MDGISHLERFLMSDKMILKESFIKLLDEIRPEVLIEKQCHIDKNILYIQNTLYDLSKYNNIFLLGSGKAVMPMAKAMQNLLKSYKPETLLVGAYAQKEILLNTTYIQSSHPLPSQKSIKASISLKKFMNKMSKDDLYIYLLSGGSSALIELLPKSISLKALEETTEIMLHSGMPINAINSVRKSISLIKGGKLARESKAEGCVLVLSDVLKDDLSVIGSTPLYNCKQNDDPIKILKSYDVFDRIPLQVQHFLLQEGLNKQKTVSSKVKHFIIGSNQTVIKRAKKIIQSQDIKVSSLDFPIEGDVEYLAKKLYQKISSEKNPQKICYIAGGEATVRVEGKGRGGRNQHLSLCFLNYMKNHKDITFLSAATDGVDGNSNASGAIVDHYTYDKAMELGLNIEEYLRNFDSYTFFSKTKDLIISGPTNNNLLDIVMIMVNTKNIQGALNG